MNKKRLFLKALSLIILSLFIIQIKPQISYALTSNDYEYSLIGNNAVITGYTGTGGNIVIPPSVDGHIVISIGDGAFRSRGIVTSITLPDSVTSIGNNAFEYCSSLTTINLSAGLRSIGDYAFSNCYNLKNLTMPNSVVGIGKYAFYNCSSISSITLSESLANIGDGAFAQCSILTVLLLPDTLMSIGDHAFLDCSSLTAINVSSSNTEYTSEDGVLYNKSKTILLCYPSSKPGSTFIIPNSVTNIAGNAFNFSRNLATVFIPNSVTGIGDQAFEFTDLIEVNIPDSVTSIGSGAFGYCKSLKFITIGKGVSIIDSAAFENCDELTEVIIPAGVKVIGTNAFSGCTRLAAAKFLGNTPEIGDSIFYGYSSDFKIYYPYGKSTFESLFYGFVTEPFYTITYDGNENTGGNIPTDENTYLQGETVSVLDNIGLLVKEGYNFDGWNTKADGSGTTYKAGTSNNSFTMGTTGNVTLYAKWMAKEDINKDGIVNLLDLAEIARYFNYKTTQTNQIAIYDLTHDGIIDIYDLVYISKRITKP